ncbi:MAG: hypothetical protein KC550_06760 [Nanoarchaeota archaeon]|nr:hypothetical protein [Nanoarchaeota archaeon]
MLGKETYPLWVKGFSENSQMFGVWKEGTKVDFIDLEMGGGTRAVLKVLDKPNRIVAEHITGLNKDRLPETKGMENWIGTTEEYILSEKNKITTLSILMHYHPDFEKMLDKGWKTSLKLLKKLCEK